MNASTATSQSVFSLRTSAFNDFLYAPIGEEENGMVLTVLSALARLGVDPWDEAARLSEQPKEAATKRLTSIISALPNGRWTKASLGDFVARLGALLPAKQVVIAQPAMPRTGQVRPSAVMMFLFLLFASALVFSVVREHMQQPAADPGPATSST